MSVIDLQDAGSHNMAHRIDQLLRACLACGVPYLVAYCSRAAFDFTGGLKHVSWTEQWLLNLVTETASDLNTV